MTMLLQRRLIKHTPTTDTATPLLLVLALLLAYMRCQLSQSHSQIKHQKSDALVRLHGTKHGKSGGIAPPQLEPCVCA